MASLSDGLRVNPQGAARVRQVGLYKIFFYCKAFVHESMIFCVNTPVGWAPHFPPRVNPKPPSVLQATAGAARCALRVAVRTERKLQATGR